MNNTSIQLDPTWLSRLENEFKQPYMTDLKSFLQQEKQQGKVIFPPGKDIFNALNSVNSFISKNDERSAKIRD